MADSPFKEGDYILLETGERGYVKSMGLRSTRFLTRDDIEITIPNSVIASSKIVNESGGGFGEEKLKVNIPRDEVDKLIKEYKKIKKREKSNLHQVKKMGLVDKHGRPLK